MPFLSGSPILDKLVSLKISHLRHYTYCRQMLHRAGISPGLRFVDYLWAAGVVMTRQNQIPSAADPETSELALIPCWDMCNYRVGHGAISSFFDVATQRNEMSAMRAAAQGEQVCMYYGDRRNELMFLNSGFVAAANPNDELELALRLEPKDALYRLKALQLKNAQLTNPMRCLLPVVGAERGDEVQKVEAVDVAGDDVSTAWMLSAFERKGLSLPPSDQRDKQGGDDAVHAVLRAAEARV